MKKTRIIILVIIVILVLLCLTLGGIYFFTDTFRSNQELFYKYVSKIDIAGFFDMDFYNEYNKKISENNYEKDGNISIKGITNEIESEYASITYTTKNDKVNKLSSVNVNVNAMGQEVLTFNILRNENLYGLIVNDILNKYIVMDNNNLKTFVENMGVANTSIVPDKLDIDSYMSKLIVSDQEKDALKNLGIKFIEVVSSKIPEDKYLKTGKVTINVDGQDINANGYKVSITQVEMYNIIMDFLKVLQNDENIYNMVASRTEDVTVLSFEDYKNQIGQLVSQIERNKAETEVEELNKEVCTVTVYEKSRRLAKIDIEIKGENENNQKRISIENNENRMVVTIYQKGESVNSLIMSDVVSMSITERTAKIVRISNENDTKWEATIETIENGQVQTPINISITRSGNADVTHQIEVRYNNQMVILLNEKTIFTDTLEIEKFEEGNYILLNNLSKEQITQVFNAIVDKINERTGMDIRNLLQGTSNNANVTSDETKKTVAKEQVQLDLAEAMAELYVAGNSYPSLDNISVEFEKMGYNVTKNSNVTMTVKKDNITATVNENHEIEILAY